MYAEAVDLSGKERAELVRVSLNVTAVEKIWEEAKVREDKEVQKLRFPLRGAGVRPGARGKSRKKFDRAEQIRTRGKVPPRLSRVKHILENRNDDASLPRKRAGVRSRLLLEGTS